nr:hypothetical protein [Tanacetum cinerariifolium]
IIPQQELFAEQAFWFHMSNSTTESFDASHVKVEVPIKLPKVILVNASLKKLKFYLTKCDSVVKLRTVPDAFTEETLILEEESRSKMFEEVKDLEAIKQNISHKPIDYVKLNQLSKDFGKCFVPQQELYAEQAFWFHMSNSTTKSFDASHVKVEVPIKLPKVIMVNASLKKLKFYLTKCDSVVKLRTVPDAFTEGK